MQTPEAPGLRVINVGKTYHGASKPLFQNINFDLGTNIVDVYINYLRKKVEQGDGPKLIHTVVGMGYVVREP